MPTPVGHSIGGLAAYVFGRHHLGYHSWKLMSVLWFAAVLPDIDYFPLLWGDLNLANYNHQWFTHSLLFALLSSVLISILGKKWLSGRFTAIQLFLPVLIAALSHLLFDYFTYDGRHPIGIPLLWPLDFRFNSPVSLFGGVAKSSLSHILSVHNLLVMLREVLISGVVVVITWLFFRRRQKISERG